MSRLPALVVCLAMAVTVAAPVAKARDVADAAPVASGVADVAKTEPAEEATADAATRRATAIREVFGALIGQVGTKSSA